MWVCNSKEALPDVNHASNKRGLRRTKFKNCSLAFSISQFSISKCIDVHQSTVRQTVYKLRKFSTAATFPKEWPSCKDDCKSTALQILSSSVSLDGEGRWTSLFMSLQRWSIEFKSRLWLAHSRTPKDLSRSHYCIVLAVFCWKENLRPSLRSWVLRSKFSSRISLYFAMFIFPSILISLPVPATEKHPHSMMLPQPCFTVGMVPDFLQTWRLAFRPKSSILVSSD